MIAGPTPKSAVFLGKKIKDTETITQGGQSHRCTPGENGS